MGALTGNTVQSTYLDLVQLGKSGAGLPAHAGKEAALHDGAGNQILGRTAVRHWLDPDPGAIAGSWEFSTTGNMTQGELETAGWTFVGCTASVTGGQLICIATATAARASTVVSLAGDFIYILGNLHLGWVQTPSTSSYVMPCTLRIGDTVSDASHAIAFSYYYGHPYVRAFRTTTYNDIPLAGAGTQGHSVQGFLGCDCYNLIGRLSGSVKFSYSPTWSGSYVSTEWASTTTVDATTFNRLAIEPNLTAGCSIGDVFGCRYIRRYV